MARPFKLQADVTRKEEYIEILDETIRTNPYRKAETAMASVMSKHGITSDASNALGKPSVGHPEKKCVLTRALKLAQSCNQKLHITKEELQSLCSDVGQVESKDQIDKNNNASTTTTTTESPSERAVMTGHLLTLIGEAQTIAKRIYETAVGLHVAEDYLRQPEDLKLLDFSSKGRIQIPNYNFNHASQLCLEWLYSTAIKWLRGFKENRGAENEQFITVFANFTRAVKDYTEAVCLANQVFRVLLYSNEFGKEILKEYVISLGYVLKNDIMMEIQGLRRAFDNIQYSFERLGWAASIAWMKYSGKNITVETLNESGIQVDHSILHHKFYIGPSTILKKDKADTGTNGSNATKLKQNATPNLEQKTSKVLASSASSRNTKSAIDGNENTAAESRDSVRLPLQADDSVAGQPACQPSKSTPEVFKPKKVQGTNKGKPKREGDIKSARTSKEVDRPSEAAPVTDSSDMTHGLLKLLKSDKASASHSDTHQSKLIIDASNKAIKKKSSPLTAPPNIPPAWRKQFGAVFGTHLIPANLTSTRKTKKKKKANVITLGEKTKPVKKAGVLRDSTETSKHNTDNA